jgi:hypothetical protein
MLDGSLHSFLIPFYDEFKQGGVFWADEEDHVIAWSIVREINACAVPKTMQNGSYDSSYFIRDGAPAINWLWDSMIMWWSIYMELPKSLDFISSVLLDNHQYWKDDRKGSEQDEVSGRESSMERYWRYCCLDTYNTLLNTLYLSQVILSKPKVKRNYIEAFMRTFSGLQMSLRGMAVSKERRNWHRQQLIQERDAAIEDFQYVIDDSEFNIGSPTQKSALLYQFMGLRPRNARGRYVTEGKKGPGNTPSSGAIPLKMAKSEHPLFRYIIEKMEAALTPGNQISKVFGKLDPETGYETGGMTIPSGRLRTSFNAVGTETTRFSSSGSAFWDGGNVQNVRKDYRDWIQADPDCILLDIDYSQSDDVFIGYESQDPDKIKVIESGADGHSIHGELFFGMPYAEIVAGKKAHDPKIIHPLYGVRQLSKRIVHGTNFQMAAMTLYVTMGREAVVAAAELLGHSDAGMWAQERLVELCGQLMFKYRRRYRRLNAKEWYAEIAKELTATGQLTNAYGTTRTFLGDPSDHGTQREATAFIGQSDTAGNMNRVMYEIDWGYIPESYRDGDNPDFRDTPRKMTWDSHGIAFHLQVHDNFVAQLSLKHPRWREAADNLLYVMNRPVIIKGREVRIRAEADMSITWSNNTLPWGGDVSELDSIVNQLHTA